AGPKRRDLPTKLPANLTLPDGFTAPRICMPGIVAVQCTAPAERFCNAITPGHPLRSFPLIVIVDDTDFAAWNLNNWLWVTFTRSNPANDVHGVDSSII